MMEKADIRSLSRLIKEKALCLGFDLCGLARARSLDRQESVLREWLAAGMNDKMGYLERDPEKRFNPELVFPGVKTLVVTGISYFSEIMQQKNVPLLSRYSYGTDYHDVIVPRLEELMSFIREKIPGTEGKAFCDTGFLHEKSWVREAGLGWQGRHSIMINREIGSFFFIGILMLNSNLETDTPFTEDYCGNCRLCIDACPTYAINENRTIDARKCISNRTIENRGPIPEEIVGKLGGRVYGCDICQDVCPWNMKIEPKKHPEFVIDPEIASMKRKDWESLTEEDYHRLFDKTSLSRIKYHDFKRNISDALRSFDYK